MSAVSASLGERATIGIAHELGGSRRWTQQLLFLSIVGVLLMDLPLFVYFFVLPAALPKFAVVVMAALALVSGVAREAGSARMLMLAGAVAIFSAVNVLALGWSLGADGASQEVVTRLTGMGVLYLTALVTSHCGRATGLRTLLAVLAMAAAAFLFADVINGYAWSSVPGRAAGSHLNPNVAAGSLMFLTLMGVGSVKPAWRPWFLMVVMVGVLSTLSRSGYVMVVVSLILLTVKGVVRFSALARAATLTAAVLVIAIPIGLRTALSDRPEAALIGAVDPLVLLRLEAGDAASVSERRQVARAAAELFLEHPFRGAGLTATTAWTLPVSTHNQPLRIAAELGIFGVVAFIFLMLVIFGVGRAHRTAVGPALVVWIAVLLTVSHNVLENWSHLASLGVLAGGYRLSEDAAVDISQGSL